MANYLILLQHTEQPNVTEYGLDMPRVKTFDSVFCFDIPTLLPTPTVTVTADDTVFCPSTGECTTLRATVTPPGTWNYSWTPTTGLTGATTATPTACPTTSTTYTCTVTDGGDCTASATVRITVGTAGYS